MSLTQPQFNTLSRAASLCVLAGAIIGIGCATINVDPPPDNTAATVWRPAANKGDAVAQLQMALGYQSGVGGLPQDSKQALHYLELSASNGNAAAQMMLADALLKGQWGLQPDQTRGRALLEQAAAQTPVAAYRLGDLLSSGAVLPQDLPAAMRWYEHAARSGYRFAAWRLAQLKEASPDSQVEAYAWYIASDSSEDAARVLARLPAANQPQARLRAAQLLRELKR
ncbi:tetratricopeptide repeat protein [Amantichitinum ursilacus]|uniref:Sel1 repeat protein n=1 Tax=Amantichitinum ursilacus TaxID=857265 RepID=A0A0N0XJZ4_9NEIS|nr:tetratricopeptide repeat protein [Amantichitinum ursilacus]KPC53755.1 Sel1 repeat protein [Amantichitinum ursilacus]